MQRLSKTQLRILNILWDHDRITAREITDLLNQSGSVAHSTVQTLLRRLERKGVVDHDVDQRTFMFYSTISRENVKKSVMSDLIESVFQGSASNIISYLVQNKYVSETEFGEIQSLIDKETD